MISIHNFSNTISSIEIIGHKRKKKTKREQITETQFLQMVELIDTGWKPTILMEIKHECKHFREELEGIQSNAADLKKNVSKEQA